MLNILLVSPQQERFEGLRETLNAIHPVTAEQAADGQAALKLVRKNAVDLVVIDEALGDMAGVELVRRLLEVNAMIHTALVSSLSPEVFHERTEGLGILMPLSPACGPEDAGALSECLRRLGLAGSR
jgi:DNA-binding response OmpR family regulator